MADNVASLALQLKNDAFDSAIQSSSGNLDDLISSMEEVEQALDQMGGSSDSAGDELSGLAEDAQSAADSVEGFSDAVQSATADVDSMEVSVAGLGGTIATVLGAAAIAAAGGGMVQAYAVQEAAVISLESALRRQGAEVASNSSRLQEYASELQNATAVADETTLAMMALGMNYGIQADQIDEAAKAAIGLAALYNMDVNTAMMLVGRAAAGNTAMFARYGIMLDDTMSQQEKFNAVLELGAEGFITAESAMDGVGKQMEAVRGRVGDLKESFGLMISAGVRPFLTLTERMVLGLQNNKEAMAAAAGIMTGVLAVAIVGLTAKTWALVKAKTALLALSGPKGWAMIAAGVGVAVGATVAFTKALQDANAEKDKLADGADSAAGYGKRMHDEAVAAMQLEQQNQIAFTQEKARLEYEMQVKQGLISKEEQLSGLKNAIRQAEYQANQGDIEALQLVYKLKDEQFSLEQAITREKERAAQVTEREINSLQRQADQLDRINQSELDALNQQAKEVRNMAFAAVEAGSIQARQAEFQYQSDKTAEVAENTKQSNQILANINQAIDRLNNAVAGRSDFEVVRV